MLQYASVHKNIKLFTLFIILSEFLCITNVRIAIKCLKIAVKYLILMNASISI